MENLNDINIQSFQSHIDLRISNITIPVSNKQLLNKRFTPFKRISTFIINKHNTIKTTTIKENLNKFKTFTELFKISNKSIKLSICENLNQVIGVL